MEVFTNTHCPEPKTGAAVEIQTGFNLDAGSLVDTPAGLRKLVADLDQGMGPVAFDIETTPLPAWTSRDPQAALCPWRGRIALLSLCEFGREPVLVDVLSLPSPHSQL